MRAFSFVWLILLVIRLDAQSGATFEWVLGPNLSYAAYGDNPDESSNDKMLNLWFSDANGTCFYPTISSAAQHYDYILSPYSRFLLDKEKVLLETPEGLVFADRNGKHLRATHYRTLRPLGEGGVYVGKTIEEEYQEIYDFTNDKVLIKVTADGNYIERVGNYFQVSGYEQATKIYDRQGTLLLTEESLNLVILATNELRLLAQDFERNTKAIIDDKGAVVVELPRNTFDATGEGDRIRVRLGAFKHYWLDLDGKKMTAPFRTPLIEGELDLLQNCGTNYKVGAYFHRTGITFPCEYDFVALTPGDTSVIRAKKNNRTYYFDRKGEPLYDATPFTITRYLGGNYFVGARNGKCEIVHVDGRTIIQTEMYPIDPSRVANVGYLPDKEGGKLMVADRGMRNMEIFDTSGTLIYTHKDASRSLGWGMDGKYIRIIEGDRAGLIDRNGEEVLPIKYRHLEVFWEEGEMKYLKTSQIYRDQVDTSKGGIGLLDGVATHLLDPKTEEILLSGNTGLRQIDKDHWLVYFGTRYGVAKLR